MSDLCKHGDVCCSVFLLGWVGGEPSACREFAPEQGTMAWSLFGLQRAWPKMAWDYGPCGEMYPGIPQGSSNAEMPDLNSLSSRTNPGGGPRVGAPHEPLRKAVLRKRSGDPPGIADAKEREAAYQKWVGVLSAFQKCGGLKRRVGDLRTYVAECTAQKATNTLLTRSGSILMYLVWAKENGHDAYPLNCDVVEEYLRGAAAAAPTRATRFLEAAAFLQFVFEVDTEAAFTSRGRGIAAIGLKRKRSTKQAPPYKKRIIEKWERRIVKAAEDPSVKDVVREIFLGHILWTVHTRSRFGDSARIKREPILDLSDGDGFVESYALPGEHKQGHSVKKSGKRFPVVGCALGLAGVPWAQAWIKLRRSIGCDAAADGCLMQEILASGELGRARMKTSDANLVLVRILREEEGAGAETYTTHSGKATLLSWAAKAGLSRSVRRMLGGHADPRDKSMLEYSRDAMAQPLNEPANMLKMVRMKVFDPDATRSGRWLAAVTACSTVTPGGENTSDGGDPPAGILVTGSCEADKDKEESKAEDASADDSTETSSDGSADVQAESADAVRAEVKVTGVAHDYPEMPKEGVWQVSKKCGTLHRALSADAPLTACGFGLKFAVSDWIGEWPAEAKPLCRRAACFPLEPRGRAH